MARVYWDTNLFIYLFEQQEPWATQVAGLRERMVASGHTLATSWLTVGEVLVRPIASGNTPLVRRYERLFRSSVVELAPFDGSAARLMAELRARTSLRPADAIQLACAGALGCDLFVTNDARLHRVTVPGVTFVCGLDRVPF